MSSDERTYNKKIKIKIADSEIEEKDDRKTLGVFFDNKVGFRKHCSEMVKSCWGRVFAISSLSKHLTFRM